MRHLLAVMRPCITSRHLQFCCHTDTCSPVLFPTQRPAPPLFKLRASTCPKADCGFEDMTDPDCRTGRVALVMHDTDPRRLWCGSLFWHGPMFVCWDIATPLRANPTNTSDQPNLLLLGYVRSSYVIMSCKYVNLPSFFMSIVATCECLQCSEFLRDAVRDSGAGVLRKERVRATEALAELRASATCSSTLRARVLDKGPERALTARIKDHQPLLSYEADSRPYRTNYVCMSLLDEKREVLF